jgi:DNA-binding NarL/FixJ family response regulator
MSFVGYHASNQFGRSVLCPLTPALRGLLEAAVTLGTTNNRNLAQYLICSEETVKSNFRSISVLFDTHNRAEAVLIALSRGWIELKRENTPV